MPEPEQFKILTGTSVAFFAKPYAVPAAVEATCVPCPLQSTVPFPSEIAEYPEVESRVPKSECG